MKGAWVDNISHYGRERCARAARNALLSVMLAGGLLRSAAAFPLKGGEKILFIGNSLTASIYNVSAYTDKGYILALDAMKAGTPDGTPWDYVVLQGYRVGDPQNELTVGPDGTLTSDGRFFTYATKLITEARAAGAVPILYMVWTINPEIVSGGVDNAYWKDHSSLTEANYKALGENLDVPVVPVGEIMHALCSTMKPDGKSDGWLYKDNVHPNDLGHALMRYAFASFFSHANTTGLQYTATLPADDDTVIRNAVWHVVQSYLTDGRVAVERDAYSSYLRPFAGTYRPGLTAGTAIYDLLGRTALRGRRENGAARQSSGLRGHGCYVGQFGENGKALTVVSPGHTGLEGNTR